MEKSYVLFDVDQEEISIGYGACGSGGDKWYTQNVQHHFQLKDVKEPQILGMAPFSASTYKPGDRITVSLVFDEIVDSQNSSLTNNSTITTSWGTMTYAGGADTNVLYFTGTVPENASSNNFTLTNLDCADQIKDMCEMSGTGSAGTGSATVDVNTTVPSISLTDRSFENGTASMKVTASNCDILQYAWTESTAVPVTGWVNCESGDTLSTRQTSGKWYLHVLGTYNATGASLHECSEVFDFGTEEQPASPLPELTLSADNDDWAKTREIIITKTPSDSEVKLIKAPEGIQTGVTVEGNSYTAAANGSYTFALTSGEETVTESIQISRLDREAPDISLTEAGGTEAVYESLVMSAIVEDTLSGVQKVEYVFSESANPPESSFSEWKEAEEKDGLYVFTYEPFETTEKTMYLHVRASDLAGNSGSKSSEGYKTVKLSEEESAYPSITLTCTEPNPAKWTNQDVTLTWTLTGTGSGDCNIYVDGEAVLDADENLKVYDTQGETGTFQAEQNGVYTVSVIDKNGRVGSASCVVNRIDKEAPVLDDTQVPDGWAKDKKISITGITDERTARFDESGNQTGHTGSGIKTQQYHLQGEESWRTFTGSSFTVTANGTYEVRLTDLAGNSETYTVAVDKIDATAPEAELSVPTADGSDGWFQSQTVDITVAYEDGSNGTESGDPSGIDSAKYAFVTGDSAAPKEEDLVDLPASGQKVTLGQESNGTYYLYYKVTDKAGNVTSGFSNAIRKDPASPTMNVAAASTGANAADGVQFTVSASGFGPSGGKLLAGSGESIGSEQMEVIGSCDGSGTSISDKTYTAKNPGTYYFQYVTGSGITDSETRYVRKVTFDSRGGTEVSAQLVWTTRMENSSAAEAECKVVRPVNPVRTGHTFKGWFTDQNFTKEIDFDTQVKTDMTLYAEWEADSYRVSYQIDGGNYSYSPENDYLSYTYGEGLTLPKPVREGYEFDGWYKSEDYSGGEQTEIGKTETGEQQFYGRWKDTAAPSLTAELTDSGITADDGTVWHNTESRPNIQLTYSDNEGVTDLYVKIDDKEYEEIAGAAAEVTYTYTGVQEGKHTYTFKARDTFGNEKETETLTVNLDTQKPEIGEITCENKAADFLDWIIGKDSLIVTVPVTETGSGTDTVAFKVQRDGQNETTVRAPVIGEPGEQKAVLTIDADWKGVISEITCEDAAGNVSDTKMISISGGVIVENNVPVITFEAVSGAGLDGWIADRESVKVTIDDSEKEHSSISAGIAGAGYSLDGGEYQEAGETDFASNLESVCSFTVEISGRGEHELTVTTADHAGNTSKEMIMIRISAQHETPEAEVSYVGETLGNLTPGETYDIDGRSVIALADGTVNIPEEWLGKEISVIRKGNDADYRDSEAQKISLPQRPDAPGGLTGEAASWQKEDGAVGIVTAEMEYRKAGDDTWTKIADDMLTDGKLTGLAAGEYEVRYQASDDRFASQAASVLVAESAPEEEEENAEEPTAPDDGEQGQQEEQGQQGEQGQQEEQSQQNGQSQQEEQGQHSGPGWQEQQEQNTETVQRNAGQEDASSTDSSRADGDWSQNARANGTETGRETAAGTVSQNRRQPTIHHFRIWILCHMRR